LLDPFDYEIPNTGGINVSRRFFGTPGSWYLTPINASQFSNGRFLIAVSSVGLSIDQDDVAEILFSNELEESDICNITYENKSKYIGIDDRNLNVLNASLMSFNTLIGVQIGTRHDPRNAGIVTPPGPQLLQETEFLRDLIFTKECYPGIDCLKLEPPDSCTALNQIESLGITEYNTNRIGPAVKIKYDLPPLYLLPVRNE